MKIYQQLNLTLKPFAQTSYDNAVQPKRLHEKIDLIYYSEKIYITHPSLGSIQQNVRGFSFIASL